VDWCVQKTLKSAKITVWKQMTIEISKQKNALDSTKMSTGYLLAS